MEQLLAALVERLLKDLGEKVVSVILYGSAAAGGADRRYSDINLFCVLTEITTEELSKSEPVFRWWRSLGHPAPLLMTEQETRSSADCFAIEFTDMLEQRKVLFGKDVLAGLTVDRRYYRAELEHELRVHLLRLRQQAASVLSDRDALLKLCIDSVSTFCVLARHLLIVSGKPGGEVARKRTIVRHLEALIGEENIAPFDTLLDLREEKIAPQDTDPATLFAKYLRSVQQLVAYVDRL
jgi:hypothetical protein